MLKHVGSNTTRRVISLMVNRFEKPLEGLWKSGLDLSSRNVQRNYLGVNKQFYKSSVSTLVFLHIVFCRALCNVVSFHFQVFFFIVTSDNLWHFT